MRRSLGVLLLLVGCATPVPEPKPLWTPEQTYEKIRSVLLREPSIRFRFWTYGARRDNEPGSVTVAPGNRIRMKAFRNSPDEVFVSNGTLGVHTRKSGDQPVVSAVPSDLSQTLKKLLLKGRLLSVEGWIEPDRRRSGLNVFDRDSDARPPSHPVLGTDEAGSPTLSYELPRESHRLRLGFDPSTFALIHLETRYADGNREPVLILTVDFEAPSPVSDDLYTIPEDPMIRLVRTQEDLAAIREALDRYLVDNHAYPTTVQSLDSLVREPQNPRPLNWKGPYLKREAPIVDPWGRPYSYRSPRPKINPEGYDLWSWGYDGKPGTADDLKR